MGEKLKSAPVYFTIVQVRFNPILALESYAPRIQERLRKQKYPDVQKGVLSTINFSPAVSAGESNAQIPVGQSVRFVFSNMERTSCFILDESALTFQTSKYDTFEKFAEDFMIGLEVVHEAVELNFIDRIGVRYLDAVFPRDGEKLAEYLTGSVLGLSEKLGGNIVHSFSETLVRKDEVSVLARAIIQNGQVGFPPDVLPTGTKLNLDERFQKLQGLHAILDTDGFTERREQFSLDRVRESLFAIHGEISKAFRATVTNNALKIWG